MTTITTPFRRSPRTVRTSSTRAPNWGRRTLIQFRRISESLNSDDRSRLCDLTLQPYGEARSNR